MAKKLDSISPRTATPAPESDEPVVETITAHQKTTDGSQKEPGKEGEAPASSATEKTPEGEETFESLFPEPGVSISSPPSWLWWGVLLIISLALAGGGYALARNKISGWLSLPTATPDATPIIKTATPTATPTVTPTPTPTATPTPTSSPDKSFGLRVLNGTTLSGAASAAKTILTSAGFTVRTIGNATHQDYTQTTIYYKTGTLSEAQAVQSALTGYNATLVQSDSLAAPDDVLVVVAKK